MRKKLFLAAVALAAVTSPILIGVIHAQTASPAFDVASVKPNSNSNPRSAGFQSLPGGALSIRNIPLRLIVTEAYGLPMANVTERLIGAPKWIDEERFDIEAKAPAGAVPDNLSQKDRYERMMPMLRKLLADRFHLQIHREIRDLPIYELQVSRSGLKLPKNKIEEKDCPSEPARDKYCHVFMGGQGQGMHGKTVTLAEVTAFVESWADRPVVDKTGVSGLFDIDTEGWVPMHPRPGPPPGQEPSAEDLAFADPARPTLGAVLDKVGLKLQSAKGPVEVVVIDGVERPTPN
jgi:uncharacterized protein (TIGR03435 family)